MSKRIFLLGMAALSGLVAVLAECGLRLEVAEGRV
jgi:hypothetical protein